MARIEQGLRLMSLDGKIRFPKEQAILFLLLAGLSVLYVWLMNPDVIGLMYDDGMYFLTAKSLLTGHGYHLLHIEGNPPLYKYPPLFPVFLAILAQLSQPLKNPIFWIKLGNTAIGIAALAILHRVLYRLQKLPFYWALGIVLLIGTQWTFIETSIELMSEPLFLLFSLLLLERVNNFTEQNSARPFFFGKLLLIISLSVLCFYTRTMGVVLIGTIALWLFLQKHWKAAVSYILATGLLCLPWMIWVKQRPDSTLRIGDFLIRSFQETYGQSFAMDLRYEYHFFELFLKGIETLLGNFSVYFLPVLPSLSKAQNNWIVLTVLIISLSLLLLLVRNISNAVKQKHVSLLGLYTGLYLFTLLFWSYYPFYPRFILLVLPFVMGFICQTLLGSSLPERFKKLTIGIFIGLAFVGNMIVLSPYIHKPYRNQLHLGLNIDLWNEYRSIFTFIDQNTPQKSVLYSDNTDETYLYAVNTNRHYADFFVFLPKAVLTDAQAKEGNRKAFTHFIQQQAEATYETLKRKQVNYLVAHRFQKTFTLQPIAKTMPTTRILLQQHSDEFKAVAHSTNGFITVYAFRPSAD